MSQEGWFRSADGVELFERWWECEGAARGSVVVLHGYCEHCGRYDSLAGALNGMGLNVYTYDQRWHGRSPGRRGYIRRFDALVEDLDCYLEHVGGRLAGRPWFLMGHSMGGLVLALYAQAWALGARGLVFSSPFVAIPDDVSPVLLALAGVLGRLTPWLPVAKLDSTGTSRDAAVVAAYDADPLIHHGRILARSGAQLNAAIDRAQAGFGKIAGSVYVMHGSEDRLVPPAGSRLLYEGCRAEDKMLKVYEGAYHELLNDLDREVVLEDLCGWLAERL